MSRTKGKVTPSERQSRRRTNCEHNSYTSTRTAELSTYFPNLTIYGWEATLKTIRAVYLDMSARLSDSCSFLISGRQLGKTIGHFTSWARRYDLGLGTLLFFWQLMPLFWSQTFTSVRILFCEQAVLPSRKICSKFLGKTSLDISDILNCVIWPFFAVIKGGSSYNLPSNLLYPCFHK